MTKAELSTLLHDVMGTSDVTEEISSGEAANKAMPRISYHEFVWTPISASGNELSTVVTYQVDFYSDYPRHAKLIALKKAFNDIGAKIQVFHEGITSTEGKTVIHSYFSVDVIEDV